MNQEKYVGMDVHQATISVAVMDCQGKLNHRGRRLHSTITFLSTCLRK